jgi:hypothetical protein
VYVQLGWRIQIRSDPYHLQDPDPDPEPADPDPRPDPTCLTLAVSAIMYFENLKLINYSLALVYR